MSGNGRVMGRLGGRDGRLARFDAVQEIAPVLLGMVKLDLELVLGHREPVHVRRIIFAAIHPNPTIGSDPFGPTFNVPVPPGDYHLDVVGIFQRGAILGVSVPDRVLGRAFAVRFDLGRPAVVHVHAPMRDVAVVPDPVQQLSAAGVVVPAPVIVDAGFDVGNFRGWPDPKVVVQLRRGLAHHPFLFKHPLVAVAGGKADFNTLDLADEPAAHNLGRFAELAALRALPGASLPNSFVFLDGFDDGLLLGDGAGERFLAVDVLLRVGGGGGQDRVRMVRHREHHGVNILAREHLAIIVVRLAVFVAVVGVDVVERALEPVLVQIANGDDLAVFVGHERVGVAGPHAAPTNRADGDALRRRRPASASESRGGNDGRGGDRHAGGGQKAASADA